MYNKICGMQQRPYFEEILSSLVIEMIVKFKKPGKENK